MCWFQGEKSGIPDLNKVCIEKWKSMNSDWKVIVLDNQTISNYVPEYHEICKKSPPREMAAYSDLLRILLLSKYGGVWVDSTVYPTQPLSEFYSKIMNEEGFFAYRYIPSNHYTFGPRKGAILEIDSWFLCADKPNHYLVNTWKAKFIENFRKYKKWPYFTFHETIRELYISDSKIKKTINGMVQINARDAISAEKTSRPRLWKKSYVYKRPCWRMWKK